MQMQLSLIEHKEAGIVIPQRSADGYINATALCQAAGKKWSHYWDLTATQNFIAELATDAGIPAAILVQATKGGVIQGTWVHPQVAINLGQWLSAKFAVMVSKWVHEWMSGAAKAAALPVHLDRYLRNDSKVPPGHFSILQETALGLFGPLHIVGFDIPKGWVPDISVGRLFCKYLRDERGVDTDALPIYWHDYFDGRPLVDAKLYPEELLPVYRAWFREVWLPRHGKAYFSKKDKSSLPYLDQLPALASPTSGPKLPPPKKAA